MEVNPKTKGNKMETVDREPIIIDGRCKHCKAREFDNNHDDMDDNDREELTRWIKVGFSSGHLGNGEGKRIYWELKVNVWEDN